MAGAESYSAAFPIGRVMGPTHRLVAGDSGFGQKGPGALPCNFVVFFLDVGKSLFELLRQLAVLLLAGHLL